MLISFDGKDNVGKSTQVELLLHHLLSQGIKTISVATPRKNWLVRWLLRTGWALKLPTLFQVLLFVDRIVFQTFTLKRLQKKHDVVILDRWSASAWVYGIATGVNVALLEWMCDRLVKVNFSVILHGLSYPDASVNDAYEADDKMQKFVNFLYESWSSRTYDSVLISTCSSEGWKNANKVHAEILEKLRESRVLA